MKTISDSAMAAIEAGEAIVTGAVEITPLLGVTYTTVGVTDLNAVSNAATTATDGLTAGVTVSGFDPADIIRVSEPSGETYVAWSAWGHPTYSGLHTGATNQFNVIPDGVATNMFRLGGPPSGSDGNYGYNGYEAARAAFGQVTFTGASSYTFYIQDNPTADNTGGLSILIERGVATAGSGAPLRLWGGYHPITLDSEVYLPIGDRGLVQQTMGAIGGVAQGLTLALSGIEPNVLDLLDDADQYRGASVVIRRLIFASDGKTLLDHAVWDRGKVDTISVDEVIGGTATINVAVESAARALGKSGARMRADSDQRLISPTDGYFAKTAYAAQKMLYWGGKLPVRTGTVNGAGPVAGSDGGTGVY